MNSVAKTAKQLASADKDEIKRLNKLLEIQQQRIEDLGKKRYKLQPTKPKKSGNHSFMRLIVPDSHGSHAEPAAIGAFLRDLEHVGESIRETVWLGDHIDCGGFMSAHHILGYMPETKATYQEDIDACNDLIDRTTSKTPFSKNYFIEGNHEHWIEQWCIKQSLGNSANAEYLLRCHGFEHHLALSARRFDVIRRGEQYCGLEDYGILKLGHCYFVHGTCTSRHAAATVVQQFGSNVVFGHTHRADEYTIKTVHGGVFKAWNPGCLCKLARLYTHTNPTNWSHGYAMQLVEPNGNFFHLTIPIIRGVSHVAPLWKLILAA